VSPVPAPSPDTDDGDRRARPPVNVLFVTVDQWRGDCLSLLGHPVVRTPALDRLAATGTLFANHWVQSAPCGPSRACLYTGTYSFINRSIRNGTPLDARFTNVALEARAAGYDPVLFGYTDTSVDPRTVAPDDPRLFSYEGVLPGFRPIVDFRSEPLTPWIDWLIDQGYERPEHPIAVFDGDPSYPGAAEHPPSWAPPIYRADQSETAYLTDRTLEWLDANAGSPWFAHVSYLRPHPPYRVVAPYHDLYDPADMPAPVRAVTPELESFHPLAAAALSVPGVRAPDDAELRQVEATYYGMMAEVDHHLGRLFDWLDRTGAVDDTIVVLTSDHGNQMGDHWLTEKLGWWDESYHVPLIVRVPGQAAGRRVDAFTEHVDVMPTVLEAMGLDVPIQCDGRALTPFLEPDGADGPADWRREAHWQWDFGDPVNHLAEELFGLTTEQCNLDVIRDRQWKYVHFAGFDPLLFDLVEDPDQLVDRSTDPTCAGVVAEYAQKLLSWRMRHADRALSSMLVTHRGLVTRADPRVL
jgi:arylsulfatase A-like enzyme